MAPRFYTDEQKRTGEWARRISEGSPFGLKAVYRTWRWQVKRKQILTRDRYACQECRRAGRYRRATTVHHVRHLKDEPELALTDSNLISLCAECHEKMHPERHRSQIGFKNEEKW